LKYIRGNGAPGQAWHRMGFGVRLSKKKKNNKKKKEARRLETIQVEASRKLLKKQGEGEPAIAVKKKKNTIKNGLMWDPSSVGKLGGGRD